MKNFQAFINEGTTERVEINPNLYAEGTNLQDHETIKSLLHSYDWFTSMINSMARMRKKRADNEYYKDELRKLGVNKIVCISPDADIVALKYQEVEL